MSRGRIIYPNNDNLQEQFCRSFVLARGDGNESLEAAHARVAGGVCEDVVSGFPVVGLIVVRVGRLSTTDLWWH
jgi:hypothetical protein